MNGLTVSAVARRLAANPRDISNLFYARKLSDSACPVVDGRRLIPVDYVPEIERALRERGRIPQTGAAR